MFILKIVKLIFFYFSDEAHERTVSTDILFGVMKMAQEKRLSQNNPLKIIVMSATLNAEKFSQYFKNCPILHVIGRQHTINVMHVTETEDDWQSAILQTVLKIHLETPPKYVVEFRHNNYPSHPWSWLADL